MYLKHYKTKRGRIYMSIAHGYRDPVTKKTRHKTIQKISYVDEFFDQYEDPIAHFKQVAARMEKERLEDRGSRVGTDELKHLGHLPLSAIYHNLGMEPFLVSRQRRFDIQFSLNDLLQLLVYTRILAPAPSEPIPLKKHDSPDPSTVSSTTSTGP